MPKNPELELAQNFVERTDRNVFLTGKAGTGKTTFLHNIKESSLKRMVVVAPTGVAAINAKGVTIHSFFQMAFGPILPEEAGVRNTEGGFQRKFNKTKINIIRSLDLLIIDEISMLRPELFGLRLPIHVSPFCSALAALATTIGNSLRNSHRHYQFGRASIL